MLLDLQCCRFLDLERWPSPDFGAMSDEVGLGLRNQLVRLVDFSQEEFPRTAISLRITPCIDGSQPPSIECSELLRYGLQVTNERL